MPAAKPSAFSNWFLGEEKDLLFENLSLLLRAGINLEAAFASLETEIENARFKQIVTAVRVDVQAGEPLWRALERQHFLDAGVIALIKIGEETGLLANHLDLIVVQERKEKIFRTRIRSALLYPVIVLTMTLVVGSLSIWISLPKLTVIFAEIQTPLPLMTRILIAISNFLDAYGIIAIPGMMVALALIVYFLFMNRFTKPSGEALLFSLPGFSRLLRGVEIARFGYVFGGLLGAGVPIIQAIGTLPPAATFRRFHDLYAYLRDRLEAGDSLEKSLSAYPHISRLMPVSVRQMVGTAEKSGHLAEVLTLIGKSFEEKTEQEAKDLAVVIEPIILVLVGIAVGCVAIGIIMPIYNLTTAIN